MTNPNGNSHQHLYHPASFDTSTNEPLGPFTCSGCGDIQITLPPDHPYAPATLAPPPPLPSTTTPRGNLPEDLQAIPEETRALALALYREHGVRVAAQSTGLDRDTVRELAIYELQSFRAARKQMRREYLKEILLRQATNLLEEISDSHDAKDKQSLATAASTLIDRLRLESGDPSAIQETRETTDPLEKLARELEIMSSRVHDDPPTP